MKRLIIYELNEVPPRLLKKYVEKKPNSGFAKILNEGIYKITVTRDDGELHPWSTWPTVHRGIPNFEHNIRYINQDLTFANRKYPPLWVDLASLGIDIGIFGSLQSFPPIYGENYKFYLPDTFSPNTQAFPKEIKYFQEFNLKLAGENKAISGKYDLKSIRMFLKLLSLKIISPVSFSKTLNHLIKEAINSKYKTRRSLIQPILGFDVFWKHYLKYQPSFSTFFTNHVAGMMHRYWSSTFPEDFNILDEQVDPFHSKSIFKAMDIADRQITQIVKYCDKNQSNLLVISSMGQKAVDRGVYLREIFLNDESKLLKILNLPFEEYKILPAMQPDIVFDCKYQSSLKKIIKLIPEIVDKEGNQLIKLRYEPVGLRVNFSLQIETKAMVNNEEIFNPITKKYNKIEDYGLKFITRDKGTAYHSKDGILLAYGKYVSNFNFQNIDLLDTCEIKPKIIEFFQKV